MTSTARIAANRRNSKKSTGPKTDAGKAISRMNTVVHGLRSDVVVLRTENAAEFESQRLAWIEDWKPQSQTMVALVERAAAQHWRLKRCVRIETTRLNAIAHNAECEYDNALNARLASGLQLLETEPAKALEALMSFASGIDLLIKLWQKLGEAAATPEGWNDYDAHHSRLLNLLGHHAEADFTEAPKGVNESFQLWMYNNSDDSDIDLIDASVAAHIADAFQMAAKIKINFLHGQLERFVDPAVIRTQVVEVQCIDISPEGLALHRYEKSHDSAFRATINQLKQVAKTDLEAAAPNEATDDVSDSAKEVSVDIPVAESSIEVPPAPSAPIEANTPLPVMPIAKSDRDRESRIWPIVQAPAGSDDPQSL